MDNKNIVILIPAYNPTEDLIPLSKSLLEKGFQVLVINDGSKSETLDIFKKLDSKVIFIEHPQNMGKGQALKTGFEYIEKNLDVKGVVTADADGQHILEDIENVAHTLLENNDNLILGSRLDTSNMPARSKFGNTITRTIFKLAAKVKVFDTQTGLRGVPSKYLKDFQAIEGQRYEYEINMLLYCAKQKIKIQEINIHTVYLNDNKASSFHVIRDSYKIYKCIFENSDLSTALLYTISSIIAFIIDFVLLLIFEAIANNSYNVHLALFFAAVGARAISSLFNFFFNRIIVFKSKTNFLSSFVKYYLLVLVVLGINVGFLELFKNVLNFPLTPAKLLVEAILFVSNYIIQKLFIFKNKKSN